MDTSVTTPLTAAVGELEFVLDRVKSGADVLITADDDEGCVLLDAVAQRLDGSPQRAIRVSVPADGLSLSGLMAAVTGRRDFLAHDDAVLELGFRTLTASDETGEGAVLLVSGAQGLQRPALRYIQFASRAGKTLRIVLAGTPRLLDLLAVEELAALRMRLAGPAIFPVPVAAFDEPNSAAPSPATLPNRRSRRVPGWAAAGLGMAASLAVGLWLGRGGLPSTASSADPAPQPSSRVAEAMAQTAPAIAPAPKAGIVMEVLPVLPLRQASTPAAAPPPAAPSGTAPNSVLRMTENPLPPATTVPAAPVQAAASAIPAPTADHADTQQSALPVPPIAVPPPARQARVPAPRRSDTRGRELSAAQAARRGAPVQSNVTGSSGSQSGPNRLDGDEGYPQPPRASQSDETFGPMYSSLGRPRSFIGTYSANPDGTRTFRMEP